MSVTFQECPGCACLIPVGDYAEQRMFDRTVHLMHCRFCRVGILLNVAPTGRTMTLKVEHPSPGYVAFLRLLDEVHRGTSKHRDEQFKEIRKSARAA